MSTGYRWYAAERGGLPALLRSVLECFGRDGAGQITRGISPGVVRWHCAVKSSSGSASARRGMAPQRRLRRDARCAPRVEDASFSFRSV